jgi:hypothetical protein
MHFHRTCLWRSFHAVCALFVVSYIAFEVLDLDGSRLSALNEPAAAVMVAVETFTEGESINRLGRSDWWDDVALSANRPEGWARPDHFAILLSSPLDSARMHGYRVGLPRDSITDP